MTAEVKEKLRYSIIPADAITDPNITPYGLRVLCLLGRHANNYGWCTRSQVKMAKELGCTRTTIYRALGELLEAGYIERREGCRKGVLAKPGDHPHTAYFYRVKLDVDETTRAHQCAGTLDGDQVHADVQGVNREEVHGVHTSGAPLTERSLGKRPLVNSLAPAAAGESGNVASLGQGEPERFPEMRSTVAKTWPDGFPAEDEVACRKQFERLTRQHRADLLMACAGLHGAELRRRQEARGGKSKQIAKRPSNWLKDGDWEGYGPQAEEAVAQEAKIATALGSVRRDLGEGVFAILRARMPDTSIAKLAGMTHTPPAAFTVTSSFQKTLLDNHLGALETHLRERPHFTLVQPVRRAS